MALQSRFKGVKLQAKYVSAQCKEKRNVWRILTGKPANVDIKEDDVAATTCIHRMTEPAA